MIFPIDGNAVYGVANVELWTKQGTAFVVGGAFVTVTGQPSQQLLASTNATIGYYNGQMLATCSGVVSGGGSSGLTAGALINFNPSATDTGQKIWNGMIICDAALHAPLPLLDPVTGSPFVYNGTILVASQLQGWVIREQYLYGPGTPATDVTIVNTAVIGTSGISVARSQIMNSSGANEVIFAY